MILVESDDAAKYPIINGHSHVHSFDSYHTVIQPQKLTILKNKVVHAMRCGGAHTILFATPRPASSTALNSVFDEKVDESLDASEGGLGYKNMMSVDSEESSGSCDDEQFTKTDSSTGKK